MVQNKYSRKINQVNQKDNTQLHIVISFIYPKQFYDLHHKLIMTDRLNFFMISKIDHIAMCPTPLDPPIFLST